ncbi:Wzy polymerase domain-containing protein [Mitsuaria sp. WAJ17]|uniref:PglL family O-oligosaccharyltransferase n=1 Tax=Mitsuaria sp. WAJ17 TaxID=2761452 RepID=UPI0028737B24|nr:Wzy polymerase domain-containing protein [Mitsuaria sp. WAJ17]
MNPTALILAATLPTLLAYSLSPSTTLLNQLLALGLWGGVLLTQQVQTSQAGWGLLPRSAAGLLAMALAVVVAVALLGVSLTALALLPALALLTSGLLVLAGARAGASGQGLTLGRAFALGLLLAGLGGALVSLVQVFLPDWTDAAWIARSGIAGRAVGNIRQPNHLASLLLWGCIAAVWLSESWGRERPALRALLPLLLWLLLFCVVLSASRTGMWFGVALLALWGVLDAALSRQARLSLLITPLLTYASWQFMHWWSAASGHAFGAEARLAEGAGSPSRVAILKNSWALLQQHPWRGVGWGDFNFAWTLTPFPDRPVAFFDHCHNLVMQVLVEMGWPLGLLMLGGLAWLLWLALRAARQARGAVALQRRCALMVVLMIGLHSMLEYPLWYLYFLLPTAFALGLALAAPEGQDLTPSEQDLTPSVMTPAAGTALRQHLLQVAGALMIAGAAFAGWDYLHIVDIYRSGPRMAPLDERIARGQRSLLFSASADYAAATVPAPSRATLDAARRTGHNLIDVRLMIAWAQSLHAVGETDKARYLVQRLREFHSTAAEEWLDECVNWPAHALRPFQCDAPQRSYRYEDFR